MQGVNDVRDSRQSPVATGDLQSALNTAPFKYPVSGIVSTTG
jgi:hypothetical protein